MNGENHFATTHWTVVIQAGGASGPLADTALETLCRTYWRPLYVFARRKRRDHQEAQDLTQDFLMNFLEKGAIGAADREKGRFRNYLLKSFTRFMDGEWTRAHAEKRGGKVLFVPLDEMSEELLGKLVCAEEGASATEVFDRQWADEVTLGALHLLESRHEDEVKREHFDALRPFLFRTGDLESYREVGIRLGMRPNAVSTAVNRLRVKYGQCFREVIENTVADPDEVDAEIEYLMRILRGGASTG